MEVEKFGLVVVCVVEVIQVFDDRGWVICDVQVYFDGYNCSDIWRFQFCFDVKVFKDDIEGKQDVYEGINLFV